MKAQLDLQVARFIYATNSAFTIVEHPEFIKLLQMVRPGYNPPNRHDVGGKLLDHVHSSLLEECRDTLKDQTVAMALDGWSNIHNEPVVCATVTTPDGHTYLTETVDTSGNQHTSDYLEEIAISAVQSAEERCSCRVGSFVTDNAANMTKMRRNQEEDSAREIISYGCSAHYMNLLAKDVEISGVKEHDVRNTLADCLQSHLDNWSTLLKVCEEHRDGIVTSISDKIKNFGIRQAGLSEENEPPLL